MDIKPANFAVLPNTDVHAIADAVRTFEQDEAGDAVYNRDDSLSTPLSANETKVSGRFFFDDEHTAVVQAIVDDAQFVAGMDPKRAGENIAKWVNERFTSDSFAPWSKDGTTEARAHLIDAIKAAMHVQ